MNLASGTFALLSFLRIALYAAKEAVPAPTRMYVACSGISGRGGGASIKINKTFLMSHFVCHCDLLVLKV